MSLSPQHYWSEGNRGRRGCQNGERLRWHAGENPWSGLQAAVTWPSLTNMQYGQNRHLNCDTGDTSAFSTFNPFSLGPDEMEVLLQFMYGAILDLPSGASARYSMGTSSVSKIRAQPREANWPSFVSPLPVVRWCWQQTCWVWRGSKTWWRWFWPETTAASSQRSAIRRNN